MPSAAAQPNLRDSRLRQYATIAAVTDGPSRTQLPDTEVLRFLNLYISGSVAVASANAALVGEGILSLIRGVTLEASSSTRREISKLKYFDMAAAYNLQQFLKGTAGQLLQPTPLTSGASRSKFNFDVQLDFEMPHSKNPRATMLNCARDIVRGTFQLVLDWGDIGDVAAGAGATVSFDTVPTCILSVDEMLDPKAKGGRYGINTCQFKEIAIVAATPRLLVDLKSGYLLRGVMIKQFTRAAVYYQTPIETAINAVSFELNRDVKKQMPWGQLKSQNYFDYKVGLVERATLDGYAFVDFMPEQQWDTIIDTRKYNDVNIVLDVNAIPNSFVRVYPVEVIPSIR